MRYSYGRLGVIAAAVFIVVSTFFYANLPDDRSFSCRTLSTCFKSQTEYPHAVPDGFYDNAVEDEGELSDGTLYSRRDVPNANPKVLFLSLNKDAWGQDFLATGRTIQDFISLLISTDLDFTTVSIALMTASRKEFDAIKTATRSFPFARISVFYQEDKGPEIEDRDRHTPEAQRKRRSYLATLRNYLMLRSLKDEPHMVWVDADIVEFSPGIVQTMISRAEERDDVGLLTARCGKSLAGDDYDLNAWQLDNEAPGLRGPVAEKDQKTAAERLEKTRHQVQDLIKDTSDTDLIPLDSVGGTILYIRSSLVHRGVSFPPFNIVGTMFGHDGWTGIETGGNMLHEKLVMHRQKPRRMFPTLREKLDPEKT
ncbi:hypothetical protein DL769_008374 [Monosporascus sp. CRB-8-3]|nr:hypothetical protein DL769_008374 [Monosporascus sp. CRB-8-3]